MVEVLQANLPYLPHGRLFHWLYQGNPEGQALAWVATDSESGRIVGVAAAFPRRVYYCGAETRGYVLGDFCIDQRHRSLGLALSLQRACLEGVSRDGSFAFDFPSRNMLAVYKRLRIEAGRMIVRYAKMIRIDRKIGEQVRVRMLARGLSATGNAGLRLADACVRSPAEWSIAAEPGPWGSEFTRAAQEWSSSMGTCVARTAEFLNWRYRDHPDRRYEILTARRAGRLCGYVVFHIDGENGTVDDLLAGGDTVRSALLEELTAIVRQRGVQTLSALSLSDHPGKIILEQSGFRPRESSPVVLLMLPMHQSHNGLTSPPWYLSAGDPEG